MIAPYLAAPALAHAAPQSFESSLDAVRQKARTAYLSQEPIDAAVTDADRHRLALSPGMPPEHVQQRAELLEAVKAVKILQDGSDALPLSPAEKARLLALVHASLGLSSAEAAQVGAGLDRSGVPSSPPGPSEPFLRRVEASEAESRRKAQTVMNDAGALSSVRGPADGAVGGSGLGAAPSDTPQSEFRASEFRPPYKPGTTPSPPPLVRADEPAGWWKRLSSKTQNTVYGLERLSGEFSEFSAERMKDSSELDMEGAALLEKGGTINIAKAGWKAVESFGNRVLAGDPEAIEAAGIGIGLAAGAAGLAIAAPVGVGAVALVLAEQGLTAYSYYGMVNALPAFLKKPDYLNAGTIVLGGTGSIYSGWFVKGIGKAVTAVVTSSPRTAIIAAAAMGRAETAVANVSKVAANAGNEVAVNAVTENIADTAKIVQYRGGPWTTFAATTAGATAR